LYRQLKAKPKPQTNKETNMYSLDTNINTAFERQAERVHTVQAYGSGNAASSWTADEQGQTNRNGVKAILALAAAMPIVLLAWGLMAR
jgi:hypothetical protein